MKTIRIAMLALAAAAVSACSGPQTATRKVTSTFAPIQTALTQTLDEQTQASAQSAYVSDIKITKITIDVPKTLQVSEKNSYYPKGDIVWRGDNFGDRHEQVKAILSQSAQNAAAALGGSRPVHLHIQATRFHGISEKARYSTGGVHNINFYVTLFDPVTGATLRPAQEVVSNLDALKGNDAIRADGLGNTQKHRVTAFLTQVIQAELTQPNGYEDKNSGFFVALNRN